MKLFLSSDGFLTRTQFKQLVGKEYKDANVGLIMNATDWMKSSEKKTRLDEVRERFERIDIKPELLDLRRFYNKTPESLLKKLQQYDLIWVRGGNTFLLRYVMKKSGFDAVIKDALKNGLVYAGESAGALVMGPTLKYIDIVDDPNVVPEMIWRGIDFVDTVPLPHWGAKKYGNTIKKTYLALRKDGVKVAKFSDGEAMLVKDKNWEKVRTNRYWR